jgi:hypothetical protein
MPALHALEPVSKRLSMKVDMRTPNHQRDRTGGQRLAAFEILQIQSYASTLRRSAVS